MFKPFRRHRKVYVERPFRSGHGKVFKLWHHNKVSFYVGGVAATGASTADLAPDNAKLKPFHWVNNDDRTFLSGAPFIMPAATLAQLLNQHDENFSSSKMTEMKYPEIFHYRYIFPTYISVTATISRVRVVWDSKADNTSFNPSGTDFLTSELGSQTPVTFYWRADFSNLNSTSDVFSKEDNNSTLDISQWQNYYELVRNSRFQKCVVSPGNACSVSLNCRFPIAGYNGIKPATDSSIFGSDMLNKPVTNWMRDNWQSDMIMGGGGVEPGNLYVGVSAPEGLNSGVSGNADIYRKAFYDYVSYTGGVNSPAQVRARVYFAVTITTCIHLMCNEWMTEAAKLGGVFPNTL